MCWDVRVGRCAHPEPKPRPTKTNAITGTNATTQCFCPFYEIIDHPTPCAPCISYLLHQSTQANFVSQQFHNRNVTFLLEQAGKRAQQIDSRDPTGVGIPQATNISAVGASDLILPEYVWFSMGKDGKLGRGTRVGELIGWEQLVVDEEADEWEISEVGDGFVEIVEVEVLEEEQILEEQIENKRNRRSLHCGNFKSNLLTVEEESGG